MAKKGAPTREQSDNKAPDRASRAVEEEEPVTRVVPFERTSPITVGGGSTSIDFDHGDYVPSGGVFSKRGDEIGTVWVYDEGSRLRWNLANIVKGKDCVLTVHTIDAGNTQDIIVRSKPGGPLTVEFNTAQFPLEDGSPRRHFNPRRQLTGVIEFKDNRDRSTATFSIPAGRCSIQFLNSSP